MEFFHRGYPQMIGGKVGWRADTSLDNRDNYDFEDIYA